MDDIQKITLDNGCVAIEMDIPDTHLINYELYTVDEIISFVDAWMRMDNGVTKLGCYVKPLVTV